MIIPAPLHLDAGPGAPLVLDPEPVVVAGPGTAAAARRLADGLGGRVTERTDAPSGRALTLRLTEDLGEVLASGVDLAIDPERAQEAYRLDVDASGAVLVATHPAGLGHGVTTLLALVAAAGAADGTAPTDPGASAAGAGGGPGRRTVPAVTVLDVPRYAWRGLHLDVARHFFGVDELAVLLGVMTDLKLNVLHLHLTDDQGWRVEIPSRPQLHQRSSATAVDGDPGGYLSTADVARLLDLAAERHITVVPEIDLPGHTNAALHALGELNPDGEPVPAYTGIGVGFSRLHADLATTRPFLQDVLGDVAATFPGPWLHIGGDEALELDPEEYRRLVETTTAIVAGTGKRVVGWQEVATTRLPAGAVVHYWDEREGADAVATAARSGARVLLSPATRTYLDMKYDATTPLGLEWAGHVPLRQAYDWEPDAVLPDLPAGAVLGVQACLWTETVRTMDDLAMLLLPRLAAVAEVAWSPSGRRDWDGFTERLPAAAAQWTEAGLAWSRTSDLRW